MIAYMKEIRRDDSAGAGTGFFSAAPL